MRAPSPPSPLFEPSAPPDTGTDGRGAAGVVASIRAHALLVAGIALLALLATLVWAAARSPTYEASAQVLVTPLPDSGSALAGLPLLRASSDRTRLVQTAASLLDSPSAASGAAAQMGSGWTAARVAGSVEVQPEGGSDVVTVTARADDPVVAARLANRFAQAALQARGRALGRVVASLTTATERELQAQTDPGSAVALDLAERLSNLRALGTGTDPTLSLTRSAEPPTSSSGLGGATLALLGLLAGLAIGVAAALVVDMLGPPRVDDVAQAVAATGLPVLAQVRGHKRWPRLRGSSPAGSHAADATPLRRLQYQLELTHGPRHRVLFVGASAGDGVTASVAQLGLTLAGAGHDVLLVDLDPRASELAAWVGAPAPPALSDILAARETWRSALADVPGVPRVKVLAVGAQGPLGIPDDVAAKLPRVLAEARATFDFVLVDAPPLAGSGEALRVVSGVDAVVVVVRPGKTLLGELESACELLGRAGKRPDGLLVVGGHGQPPASDQPAVSPRLDSAPGAAPIGRSAEV